MTRLNISICVILFCTLVNFSCNAASINKSIRSPRSLDHKEAIDTGNKYFLGWSVNEEKQEITFEVEVQTKGYVGFGISPNGAMTGADIFIAGVFDNKTSYSGDYHGTRNGRPTLDKQQDWSLLEATENATHTKLKFSRFLDTCDSEDFPINGDTSRVIWSIGSTDEIAYHAERGSVSLNFLTPDQPFDPADYEYFDISVEMEMPAQDTSYWCTLHKGKTFQRKAHMIGFEASLPTAESVEYTHHFVLFACNAPEGQDPDEFFGQYVGGAGGECFREQEDMLPFFPHCQRLNFVWAKGGKRMVFPDDVGYPMGENPGQSQYYMMEIHYDNPKELSGIKFETGLRTYFTYDLRKIEADLMFVGNDVGPSTVVPPETKAFMVSGHCSSECTKEYLPEDGITVFNVFLHAHLSGRKLKVRHFRDGEELPWIDNDALYDFNYQQSKALREYVKILPGDHITYELEYDSTWDEKKGAVVGGYSSRDEMSQAFFWYFPKSDLMNCASEYPREQGLSEFGFTKYRDQFVGGLPSYYIEEPEHLRGSYKESLSYKVNWTEEFRAEFQEKRRFGLQYYQCNSLSGMVKYPEIEKEYVPEDKCATI